MSLQNVNDRSKTPSVAPSGAPENPTRVEATVEQVPGCAVITQTREVQQAEQPSIPTQALTIHSEPKLASSETQADLEQKCAALLSQVQRGVVNADILNLLEEACKKKSTQTLSMLMDHIFAVDSSSRNSMMIGDDKIKRIPFVTTAIDHQWIDGLKLALARGASVPPAKALGDKTVRQLLGSEKLLSTLMASQNMTDKQSLLDYLLERSLESGSSLDDVSALKLISLGANLFAKPSAMCLARWCEYSEKVRIWRESFSSDGYPNSLREVMNNLEDDELTRCFMIALKKPCQPGTLLDYACQQGHLEIVKHALNTTTPANAKRLAKMMMFHVIAETRISKNYAGFAELMLEKALCFGNDEGQTILDEWLLASALHRNSDAWSALVEAGANSSCLKQCHPDAVIDTFIQNDFFSKIGFFLIEHDGHWYDGPNDGDFWGERLINKLCALDENSSDMFLLDVVSCADLLRHQKLSIHLQPSVKIEFTGKPLYMTDKVRGFDYYLKVVGTMRMKPMTLALGWRDAGLPVAVLSEIERLKPHLQVWEDMLGLEGSDSDQRWLRAVLWLLGSIHENMDVKRLYDDCHNIRGLPSELLKAFAFQSACDLAECARAKLKTLDRQWEQLPAIAVRYLQDGAIDQHRLSKRLQKLGLFEPNAVRVAEALSQAYQRASGYQAEGSIKGTVSEQMAHAQQALVTAVAKELPTCLAAVGKAWSEESGRPMPKLIERYLNMTAKEKKQLARLADSTHSLNKVSAQNSRMLLDMVTSQFDDLLKVFGLQDSFASTRTNEAASWLEQTVTSIYQQWLRKVSSIQNDDDSDSFDMSDSEDSLSSADGESGANESTT